MADLKLYYFPVRSLGEGARMLFAYAGRDYEDIRIPFEQWRAFKPSTPLGQMPVLEMNGQKYAQSLALTRYLGREFGFAGKNSQEDLEIDQHVYFVEEIRQGELKLSKMADLKLYYFPVRALGDGARMLFAYAGREYEDVRIPSEQWQAFKPSTVLGQLPILEINGQKYAQSLAIARYLGREFGLAGKNSQEDLEIDQNILFVDEIRQAVNFVFYVKDEKIKAILKKDQDANYLPDVLKRLNDIIVKNNGHLALGRLTWADFWFAGVYDRFKLIIQLPDIEQRYPALKSVRENVLSIPKVKAYHDQKAPKSAY